MNIKNVKDALSLFEKHEIKRGEALAVGNSSKANYHYDKIREIIGFLKKEKALPDLSIFLEHPNPYVTSGAAVSIGLTPEYSGTAVAYVVPTTNRQILSVDISELQGSYYPYVYLPKAACKLYDMYLG